MEEADIIPIMLIKVFLDDGGKYFKGFMYKEFDELLTLSYGDKYTIFRDKTFDDIKAIVDTFLQYLNELKGDVKNENA